MRTIQTDACIECKHGGSIRIPSAAADSQSLYTTITNWSTQPTRTKTWAVKPEKEHIPRGLFRRRTVKFPRWRPRKFLWWSGYRRVSAFHSLPKQFLRTAIQTHQHSVMNKREHWESVLLKKITITTRNAMWGSRCPCNVSPNTRHTFQLDLEKLCWNGQNKYVLPPLPRSKHHWDRAMRSHKSKSLQSVGQLASHSEQAIDPRAYWHLFSNNKTDSINPTDHTTTQPATCREVSPKAFATGFVPWSSQSVACRSEKLWLHPIP